MTPEISFKVVVFGQTVKEYYTYLLEYIVRKNISNIFFLFNTLISVG